MGRARTAGGATGQPQQLACSTCWSHGLETVRIPEVRAVAEGAAKRTEGAEAVLSAPEWGLLLSELVSIRENPPSVSRSFSRRQTGDEHSASGNHSAAQEP